MSNKIFFIADTHFGHENMAKHRGFQDTFYHDEHIIDKWNSVVNKRDTVYLLGDVTMESKKYYNYFERLNGLVNVVLGNHDPRNYVKDLLPYVNSVAGMLNYKDKTLGRIFLTHCPIHPMELDYRVSFNIHGHIHDKVVMLKGRPDPRYICVSCEHIDYTPKTIEQLINKNK